MKVFEIVLAICLLGILFVIPDESQDVQAQEDLYCEMVQLSMDTKGDLGWPDYENKFKRVCAA